MVTAAFQDIDKSHEVGLNISMGILYGIPDPGLGSEIDHRLYRMLPENILKPCQIA